MPISRPSMSYVSICRFQAANARIDQICKLLRDKEHCRESPDAWQRGGRLVPAPPADQHRGDYVALALPDDPQHCARVDAIRAALEKLEPTRHARGLGVVAENPRHSPDDLGRLIGCPLLVRRAE
jgi:hypothetical protein